MEPLDEILYERVDKYRAEIKISALAIYDIPKFIGKNPFCGPTKVLKYVPMRNACLWRPYEIACGHYEKYQYLIDNLIEGIILKGSV